MSVGYKRTLPPLKSAQEQLLGADLALQDWDLQINPGGDLKLIQGTTNMTQALSLLMTTRPGELPVHPRRGLAVDPGRKATPDTLLLFRTAARQALLADARVQSVRQVRVSVERDVFALQAYVVFTSRAQPFALDTRGGL